MSLIGCLLACCCIDVMFSATLHAHETQVVTFAEDSKTCDGCNAIVETIVTRDPGLLVYRCAKCEARRKEERNAFAQKILTNVAQFLQGIFMLASSGKDGDSAAKAGQVALMAQAVGSIIYESHEYDQRGNSARNKITDDVASIKNRIISENLHDYNAVMDLLREALRK